MYLHQTLGLLVLLVAGTGGVRKHSIQKDSYDSYDYDYDYEEMLEQKDYFNDRDYLEGEMYDDTPPPPARNKLLIIVLGG